MIGLKDFIGFFEALFWPVVVVLALVFFRKPLSRFLENLSKNFQSVKLSVLQVTLELSKASEFQPTWTVGSIGEDLRQLTPATQLVDAPSTLVRLFEQLKGDATLDYLIIDLGTGHQWLTSRLYIFAIMLERMRGLRCLVFLETSASVDQRFLGIASPRGVRWALARRYPWLETAFATAYVKACSPGPPEPGQTSLLHRILSTSGALDPSVAQTLVYNFLDDGKIQQTLPPGKSPDPDDGKWESIKPKEEQQQLWEHAKWLNATLLKNDLGNIIQCDTSTWLKENSDISPAEQVRYILRRKSPFVALVDEEKKFVSLIDRQDLLERVAARLGAISESQ
jgi:hypothetical protein